MIEMFFGCYNYVKTNFINIHIVPKFYRNDSFRVTGIVQEFYYKYRSSEKYVFITRYFRVDVFMISYT